MKIKSVFNYYIKKKDEKRYKKKNYAITIINEEPVIEHDEYGSTKTRLEDITRILFFPDLELFDGDKVKIK